MAVIWTMGSHFTPGRIRNYFLQYSESAVVMALYCFISQVLRTSSEPDFPTPCERFCNTLGVFTSLPHKILTKSR